MRSKHALAPVSVFSGLTALAGIMKVKKRISRRPEGLGCRLVGPGYTLLSLQKSATKLTLCAVFVGMFVIFL